MLRFQLVFRRRLFQVDFLLYRQNPPRQIPQQQVVKRLWIHLHLHHWGYRSRRRSPLKPHRSIWSLLYPRRIQLQVHRQIRSLLCHLSRPRPPHRNLAKPRRHNRTLSYYRRQNRPSHLHLHQPFRRLLIMHQEQLLSWVKLQRPYSLCPQQVPATQFYRLSPLQSLRVYL